MVSRCCVPTSPTLVRMLADLEGVEDLTLTSNAFLLAEHATRLRDAGLGRVTISLDSLEEEVFQRMNGGRGTVGAGARGDRGRRARRAHPIKINCVVEKGVNDHTVVDLAEHFRGTGHIVRFIEFMDVGTLNRWDLSRVVPAKEIVERIAARFPLEPLERDYRGEVARRWGYRDGAGEIGVIASVTEPFCADCTRARLSPEGQLVTCLFASAGHDLRAPLRSGASDEEIRQMVQVHLEGAQRSLLGGAGRETEGIQPNRDVPHRRLIHFGDWLTSTRQPL